MPSLLRQLRERKLVQWALAYLGGAWLVLQVFDVFVDMSSISAADRLGVSVLLALGFLICLVLAWYHGEKGAQRVSGPELLIIALLLGIAGSAVAFFTGAENTDSIARAVRADGEMPLVVMMDSHHPRRVYDEQTVASGGTNADVVSDILLDLPIIRQREPVSPAWHRDEDILGFRPDLIIIHYSAFRQEYDEGPRTRLRLFIEFFAGTDTEFLVYGRRDGSWLRERMDELLRGLDSEHAGLLERVHVFGLLDYGARSWKDPATATPLKLRVKEILDLP
ncbi:MAG: hypothetical protein ACE5FP_05815 [Gemmatimonadota bacterium]